MGDFNKKGLNIYFDDLNFEDIINRKLSLSLIPADI